MSCLNQLNMDLMCRTCRTVGEFKSMYDNIVSDVCLAEMLMICTPLEYCSEDELPKQICRDCVIELVRSYKFALKCKVSNDFFREYANSINNLKIPSVENEFGKDSDVHPLKITNCVNKNINNKDITEKIGITHCPDNSSELYEQTCNLITYDTLSIADLRANEIHGNIKIEIISDISLGNIELPKNKLLDQNTLIDESNQITSLPDSVYILHVDPKIDIDEVKLEESESETKSYKDILRNANLISPENNVRDKNNPTIDSNTSNILRNLMNPVVVLNKIPNLENFQSEQKNQHRNSNDQNLKPETMSTHIEKQTKINRIRNGTKEAENTCNALETNVVEANEKIVVANADVASTNIGEKCHKYNFRQRSRSKQAVDYCESMDTDDENNLNKLLPCATQNDDSENAALLTTTNILQDSVSSVTCDSDKTTFICENSDKCFTTTDELTSLLSSHHDNEEGMADCLKSPSKANINENLYSCKVCQKSFVKDDALKMHISTHNREKKYSCKVCNRLYATKTSLTHHMRTHTGEKPFSCTVCNKSLSCKGNLISHMRLHSEEKSLSCTVCGRSFRYKRNYTMHMVTHTGQGIYSCTVCTLSFGQKTSLTNHMRTHTGEKPFPCTLCTHRFARGAALKLHLRTHSGEKPYACTDCSRLFSIKRSLIRHMRIHTRDNLS